LKGETARDKNNNRGIQTGIPSAEETEAEGLKNLSPPHAKRRKERT